MNNNNEDELRELCECYAEHGDIDQLEKLLDIPIDNMNIYSWDYAIQYSLECACTKKII